MTVLATGVSAGAIETILSASVDCAVVSVSRAPNATTESYESNFYLSTFNSRECPDPLKLVTHITAPEVSLFFYIIFVAFCEFPALGVTHHPIRCHCVADRMLLTCRATIIAFLLRTVAFNDTCARVDNQSSGRKWVGLTT